MRYTKHGIMPESEVLHWIKRVLRTMKTPGTWIIPRSRLEISKLEDGTVRLQDLTAKEYHAVVGAASQHEEDTGGGVIRDKESLETAEDLWCEKHFEKQRAQDILDMTHFISLAGYEIEIHLSDMTNSQLETFKQEIAENE